MWCPADCKKSWKGYPRHLLYHKTALQESHLLLEHPQPYESPKCPSETHRAPGTCPVHQPSMCHVHGGGHPTQRPPAGNSEEEVTCHPAVPSVCGSKKERNKYNWSCKPSLGQQPPHPTSSPLALIPGAGRRPITGIKDVAYSPPSLLL